MSDGSKYTKNPKFLALAATALISYLIGAASTRVGLAQLAQEEKGGPGGNYQFTVQVNPEKKKLEAMLLDTRTAAVYVGAFDNGEKAVIWKPYVEPRFARK